ncbi:MAG: LamG domain-containing protein [Planctomycetes bacterium]|nr:LamG domain-containing protein [Planctomycetota bacterium]
MRVVVSSVAMYFPSSHPPSKLISPTIPLLHCSPGCERLRGTLTQNTITQTYIFDSQTGRLIIYYSLAVSGDYGYGIYDGTNKSFAAGLIATGAWNHIAIVFDGVAGEATLYINGVQAGDVIAYVPKNLGGAIRIGNRYSDIYGSRAKLDDVRIYDEALPLWKIKAIYNFGKGSEECEPWQRLIRPTIQPVPRPLIGV